MPELPDVEAFKIFFDEKALDKNVAGVDVYSDAVLKDTSPAEFAGEVAGCCLVSSRRHGKQLFVELSGAGWLRFHFGMTGFFEDAGADSAEPEHTRLVFVLEGGSRLAYVCQRKLGEVELVSDVDTYLEANDIGPDVLASDFGFSAYRSAVAGSRAMVKSVLMDQSRLAGIGNIYADEILFQLRQHPERKISDFDDAEHRELYQVMRNVLEVAVQTRVEAGEFPPEYLTPVRAPGEKCPRCRSEVTRIEVSGRGTYICPECQPVETG